MSSRWPSSSRNHAEAPISASGFRLVIRIKAKPMSRRKQSRQHKMEKNSAHPALSSLTQETERESVYLFFVLSLLALSTTFFITLSFRASGVSYIVKPLGGSKKPAAGRANWICLKRTMEVLPV